MLSYTTLLLSFAESSEDATGNLVALKFGASTILWPMGIGAWGSRVNDRTYDKSLGTMKPRPP